MQIMLKCLYIKNSFKSGVNLFGEISATVGKILLIFEAHVTGEMSERFNVPDSKSGVL